MKGKILLLYFGFFCLQSFAQSFNIQWKGNTVIDYGTEKITVPFFTNDNFAYENGNVYFRYSKKADGDTYAISDLSWQPVAKSEIYDLHEDFLPADQFFERGSHTDTYTGEKFTNFRISTLKVENNKLYRLVSFNIIATNNKSGNAQFNSVIGSTENPLESGSFFKIRVDKTGVFKITSKFLRDHGLNPANINPKNFRIYGNGGLMLPENNSDPRYNALQENAIQVIGEEDGVWNEDDYALFYAQGPHGFNIYENSRSGNGQKRVDTRLDRSSNFINIYEDHAYYFISFDKGPGKRILTEDSPVNSTVLDRYDDFQYINEEKFNLMKLGRIWTGDIISGEKEITFTTKSPLRPSDIVHYRSRHVGFQAQGNSMQVSFNNTNPVNFSVSSSDTRTYILSTYSGSLNNLTGNKLQFSFKPNFSNNPNGKFYLDYAEVQYKEDLIYRNGQFNFRNYDIIEGSGNRYTFKMEGSASPEQIWDVSDLINVKKKVNKSGSSATYTFGYKADHAELTNEFVAFTSESAYVPEYVGKIANQNLGDHRDVDYLMITVPEMMGEAQRLADYYKDQYKVAVVDVNKIYNEYSSGSRDITAIRDYVTFLDQSSNPLKYLLILGDTSYDFKGKNYPGSCVVPSYQSEESNDYARSFVTDDYFVMTSQRPPNGARISTTLPDLPVGRLPAANVAEAKLLVDKTLAYYNALPGQSSPFGEWRMKLDFVVDDDADNGVPFHNTMNASLVNVFEAADDKKEYNIRKLYLDSFPAQSSAGGQRYPQINQAISNDVGNSLYLFYFGHGGINGWAQERVLTIDEIQNFNNYNRIYSRFPLVSTITCEFTLWDDPATFSAGEQVIKLKKGGAASMITSSRAIGVSYGEQFTTIFTDHIFRLINDDFLNLGDAFLQAKLEKGPSMDHLRVNFLGDPAMKLSRPKRLVAVDDMESTSGTNEMRALDFVKIKGHIKKENGTIDENFNGRVAVNIFDKKLKKQTLNNDGNLSPVLKYEEEGSPIVKSSGTAKGGVFEIEFYVPKDINYEVGPGRMLIYADNKKTDVFYNGTQQIGGINPAGIDDDEPPKVKLFLNNTNFADGGITNQNPLFLACITDDKGINSTGSGIGHDATVILDGKIIDTVVLNDFYFSGDGNGCVNPGLSDYQKGNISYPFRNLTPGNHQLTFKIWDINNNSTTTTLNFVVKEESDQNLIVKKLLNWPNPFTDKTYVHFEHNCDDVLDVNVQIYTITGKIVKTITTMISAEPFLEGFRTPRTAIEWDGTDDYGDAVGKGTYLFKIMARSQNQDKCKGSATAVEKMVLLK